jgi:hypothetical protein
MLEGQRGRPCRMGGWGTTERHVGFEQPPAEGQVQVFKSSSVWVTTVRASGTSG